MTYQVKIQARSTSNPHPQSVVRVLRWYEKNGDRLIGEAVLDAPKLPKLQQLFEESANNLMVDSYPVSVAQVERLQYEIAEPIDLSAYDCYLECDAA